MMTTAMTVPLLSPLLCSSTPMMITGKVVNDEDDDNDNEGLQQRPPPASRCVGVQWLGLVVVGEGDEGGGIVRCYFLFFVMMLIIF
jgi:hypothetical protein